MVGAIGGHGSCRMDGEVRNRCAERLRSAGSCWRGRGPSDRHGRLVCASGQERVIGLHATPTSEQRRDVRRNLAGEIGDLVGAGRWLWIERNIEGVGALPEASVGRDDVQMQPCAEPVGKALNEDDGRGSELAGGPRAREGTVSSPQPCLLSRSTVVN